MIVFTAGIRIIGIPFESKADACEAHAKIAGSSIFAMIHKDGLVPGDIPFPVEYVICDKESIDKGMRKVR